MKNIDIGDTIYIENFLSNKIIKGTIDKFSIINICLGFRDSTKEYVFKHKILISFKENKHSSYSVEPRNIKRCKILLTEKI